MKMRLSSRNLDSFAGLAAIMEYIMARFLTAEWSRLAMVNYKVEPDTLLPYVPAGTELDEWGGTTYASLVGFLFLHTRVLGLPIPFHVNFEEVNLRFYVRRKSEGEWKRGVVFIKEIVPRFAIAAVARIIYNEKYVSLPMRHSIQEQGSARAVEYGWRHSGRWSTLKLQTREEWRPSAPGSEEEFITEHYWGYSAQPDGGCVEYRVEHPRWNGCSAVDVAVDVDVAALYGPQFEAALRLPPQSAFLAEGSAVIVHKGQRLRDR